MRLDSAGLKRANLQAVSTDVAKYAAFDDVVVRAAHEIQRRCGELLVATALDADMMGAAHGDAGSETSDPRLIIELPVFTDARRTQLVRVEQMHAGLQRHVAEFRRTRPGAVRETDSLELHVLDRALKRALDFHERRERRRSHAQLRKILVV